MSETVGPAGYHWTGHPLVDMGVATLTAFSGRNRPEEMTPDDLEKFAKYAEQAYFTPAVSGYLTVLFTANYINPSWTAANKHGHVANILRSFKVIPDSALPPCSYCGRPSIHVPYIDAARGSRAYRDLVPMLSGERIANFFPDGDRGLSLCALCVVALQALAIGAPMCEGRALIIFSDSPELMMGIVNAWLPEQRKRIQLSQATGEKPAKLARPRSRLIEKMEELQEQRAQQGRLTMYLLSNSGQGPSVEIHELPATITSFTARAKAQKYREAWKDLVQRAWERPSKDASFEDDRPRLRNYLYEDLFSLPDQAGRFIRVHFLRKARQLRASKQAETNPAALFGGWRDAQSVSWNLTELFAKEVIAMEKQRIDSIKQLGDRLAEEIVATNDRNLWWSTYAAQGYPGIRNALIRQSRKSIADGRQPVISFDHFLTVFEEGEELARVDWRLAWDLVLIRLIEQLHAKKWFEQNKKVLESEEEKA
ncbi:MAG: type I-B CRISPR-associated protein Cas8b1/Cst1 [Chloroflexi bacterium]|nr:type I-B CRISPR-associated protein Cas8b1/Cst1 [Chloroflexota bacterium]